MSNPLPPSKYGAGYVYGRGSAAAPAKPQAVQASPTPKAPERRAPRPEPRVPDQRPPVLHEPAATPIAPAFTASPPPPPAPPTAQPAAAVPTPAAYAPGARPSGTTAIAAGVLALLIGAYRAFQTYGYIAAAAMLSGIPREFSSSIHGTQAFVTVAAIMSAVGTLALVVGAIKLLNRGLGGRGLITLGCLIGVADVVVTWIAVYGFMQGISGFYGSLGGSPDSLFSAVLSEQLPFIVLNIAISAGIPVLTIILAWSASTRRWCEARHFPVPPAGAVATTTPQPDATLAPDAQPHAEYQRQAAQHFGAEYPRRTTGWGQSSYLTPPPAASRPAYASQPQAGARESFDTRLMEKGMRGELFQQPWFHKFRNESPDQFVYITYGGGILISFLLYLIPSLLFSTVMTDALWLAIGYLFFALGTKLAHQFLVFGICIVGAVVMVLRCWSVVSAMAITSSYGRLIGVGVEPTALLVLDLLLNIAVGALLGYIGVHVHREMQRLSAP